METAVASDVMVTASDVLAAQARLRRYLEITPTHYAERFGCWLKLENLQRTGSYKVRGALNALLVARERGDEPCAGTGMGSVSPRRPRDHRDAALRASNQDRRCRTLGRNRALARRQLRRSQDLRC